MLNLCNRKPDRGCKKICNLFIKRPPTHRISNHVYNWFIYKVLLVHKILFDISLRIFTAHISRNNTFLLVFLFQITWARQLQVANTSYQILTIGESTYIDDSRFIIDTSTVNYVRL